MMTFFMHLNATRAWLSLTVNQREHIVEQEYGVILAQYPAVKVRFYDVEAFSARCSDIVVFETEDIDAYAGLIDDLRKSSLYSVPYFEIIDIFPAKAASFI